MDGKMLARLGAIVFVAIAITATAIEMTREGRRAPPARRHRFSPRAIRCARASAAASSLARGRGRAIAECLAHLGREPRPLPRPPPAPAAPQQNEGR
jgi:conjugative transfer region protein TrbK